MRTIVIADEDGQATAPTLASTTKAIGWTTCSADELDEQIAAGGSEPVAVVALGNAGSNGLRAAARHGAVTGLVLWDTPLTVDDVDLVREWSEVAVLGVADPASRLGLAGTVDAYLASAHPASDLWVGSLDTSAAEAVVEWLGDRDGSSARVDEVVVHSADGWEIHGTRWLPDRPEPVPGVVLLHTGRSDRAAYARLERLLADAGLAVLNIDWRGRGQSTNLGSYFDLPSAVKDAAWQDAMAAIRHLAEHDDVDADRIGVVGTVHGAEYAARAAWRDPRVKAMAILTGYRPMEPEEGPHLTSGGLDVLYITCTGHQVTTAAMKALYDASPPGRAQYTEYPGAPIGYQLFELDPELEPRIVAWFAEVLTR